MSNSSLVDYVKISPNKNSPRNHKIDTITIHCVVGQLSVETLGSIFAVTSKQASSNYGIGPDGRIGMYVEEKDRSWCSSNPENDHRAITIEVASDTTHPYAITDKAYTALVELCADICKRNNIKELKWKGDKSLIGKVDQQNMTVHRWFANKACPGDYIYSRLGQIASEVNSKIGSASNSKSIDEIAQEVIKGLWGNGQDRINRLTKAGYNPTEIQNRVNELLEKNSGSGKKTVDEIAREVIKGLWGNGQDRINRLTKAGYNPTEIQDRVNKLL